MVRTLIVASATLAILVVCFTIYQYSQLEPEATRAAGPRLPDPPEQAVAGIEPELAADAPSIPVGQVNVGAGRNIRLHLYPREGTRARLAIAVREYGPIAGVANEFRLVDPEIRLRSTDGRAVRINAAEGILEAQRKSGNLDPRRGRLTGGVVIKIDRLTEEERSKLPEAQRNRDELDPAELIQVEVEEIDFDLEYSKVVVPRGRLHLSGRDIDFRAGDLEARFNEQEGRVEYLRINRGGRLELRESGQQLGFSIPRTDGGPETRVSLISWLYGALEATLEAQEHPRSADESPAAESLPTEAEDGTPIFRLDEEEEEKDQARPPVRYFARFEGDIDATQLSGDVPQARLRADMLEILRAFTEEDKARMRSTSEGDAGPEEEEVAQPTAEQIVLTWSGRLVLEALTPDHARWSENPVTRITATGSPARLTNPQGDATCTVVTFEPEGSKVWLDGTKDGPVVVRSADQGVMTGLKAFTERRGDALYVRITGPGTLQRHPEIESASPADPTGKGRDISTAGNSATARDAPPPSPLNKGGYRGVPTTATSSPTSPTPANGKHTSEIRFTEQLELHGRFVTTTTVDFKGIISTGERRVFDRAEFRGQVRMHEGDTNVEADLVNVAFGPPRGGGDNHQTVEGVEARGHVLMTQGEDRVTCREMELALTTDRQGDPVPLTATARGDVDATQGTRTISAREELTVDFETIERSPASFDAHRAYAHAVAEGLDPARVDWESRRAEYEGRRQDEIGVKRLRAAGAVAIVDPDQKLDVRAEHVDCAVVDGREIEKATVTGEENRPASVRLEDFSVTGGEIHLNVPEEWAQVPGAGRMTFRSRRDLDGRQVEEPIPVSITWEEEMKYIGGENRATFNGNVHAASATTTTFDCGKLLVEFDDDDVSTGDEPTTQDLWIFQDAVERIGRERDGDSGVSPGRFSKELAYILASEQAAVETAELDAATGRLESRARLAGPRLSLNLRPEVSKMLIEGAGTLLLEDFRPAVGQAAASKELKGLFSIDEKAGPSKTLISWEEFMWYDFSVRQTRFEGNVNLKHFSGAALERIFGPASGGSTEAQTGRSTFLTCGILTVDFLGHDDRARERENRRMGALSAESLRQFEAARAVKLQDESEGLSLAANRVVYEKDRDILAIHGSPRRKFQVVLQKPGEPPKISAGQRAIYNLKTGKLELLDSRFNR